MTNFLKKGNLKRKRKKRVKSTLRVSSTVFHDLLDAFMRNMVVLATGVPPVMSRLAIRSAALFDGAQAKMALPLRLL